MTTGRNLLDKWKLAGVAVSDARLTDAARRVLHALLDHLNSNTGECFPSAETMAAETGLTERSVFRAVETLTIHKYIAITTGGGRGISNRYAINFGLVDSAELFRLGDRKSKPRKRGNGIDFEALVRDADIYAPSGGWSTRKFVAWLPTALDKLEEGQRIALIRRCGRAIKTILDRNGERADDLRNALDEATHHWEGEVSTD